jgi:hypothetical protein
MKTQSLNLFTAISTEHTENLVKEVRDILLGGFNHHHGKTFSTADLWNIQRKKRSQVTRRYIEY